MKPRTALFALMISLALLTGCMPAAESDRENFEEYRANLGLISLTADLRADYGETVADFTLEYKEGLDDCHVKVVEPQLISGAGVTLSKDGASMEYEGIILSVGELSSDGKTPVTVLPVIAEALHEWQLTDLRIEEDGEARLLMAELSDMDASVVTVWFDEDMELVMAELAVSGYTVAYCEMSEWKVESGY